MSTRTRNSSYCGQMDNYETSDAVLELGKRIVNQLGPHQEHDTLGRWMAHYIAEKIVQVDTASGKDLEEKKSACADAILRLWSHRSELPNGKRPFEAFEPILRALESLDPDDTRPRYFRQARHAAETEGESPETKEWLELASGIDYTARILIRYCLVVAAGTAVNESREWVSLADAAGSEDDFDIRVVRALSNDSAALDPGRLENLARERATRLLERLDAFAKLSRRLASHLRRVNKQGRARTKQ